MALAKLPRSSITSCLESEEERTPNKRIVDGAGDGVASQVVSIGVFKNKQKKKLPKRKKELPPLPVAPRYFQLAESFWTQHANAESKLCLSIF